MLMTIDDIVATVQSNNKLTRQDVLDALETYQDAANEQQNISNFIDQTGIINEAGKQKVLADLSSYPVSYPR